MKICLTFSAGGHFTEMRRIMDIVNGKDFFYVTIKTKNTQNLSPVYFLRDTAGPTKIHMFFNIIIITIQSIKIIIKEKPYLIISTGADVTIPLCYIGKLFGAKLIFLESLCRVKNLSPTGKLIYPVADLFLVQWKNLSKVNKKAKYWGSVI